MEQERLDQKAVSELLLQGAGIGTWVWNVQTGETRFNARWAEIVGYTLDELSPTSIDTWKRLTHPDDLARSGELLQRHFSGLDSQYVCQARLRHKDGHWVHVLDTGKLLVRDKVGQPLWMFGSHIDITKHWQTELERNDLLEKLSHLAVHVPGFLYQFRVRPDGSSHFPYATQAISEVYGCQPEDVVDDASPVFSVLYEADRDRIAASIADSARTLAVWHDRYRVNHPRHGLIWVEGRATPEKQEDGSIIWHGYLRDVTSEKKQSDQVQLAAKVFSASQEAIMIADADARILEINAAFSRITGYSRDEVIGKNPSILSSGRQGPEFYAGMWRDIAQTGRWRGEIWNRRKTGEVYAEMLSIDTVKDSNGELQNYISVFSDISKLKEHAEELDRIAHYDVLTGLPNRRVLDDRLAQAIQLAKRDDTLVAVCFLDIDGFKSVNDALGHELGDQLLIDLAQDLRKVLRPHDTVARIGGDEFVLVLPAIHSRNDVIEVVQRVLEVSNRDIQKRVGSISVSASIGIAIYPEFNRTPDELLRYADQAMYRAKQQGRNRYVFFDSEEDDSVRQLHSQLSRLEQALDAGEFRLYFMPKIDLVSGRVRSAEALIRWQQPGGSIISAGQFMDAVVGHPLEMKIGHWVLHTALQQFSEWLQLGLELPVSINISADHLLHPDFVSDLQGGLSDHTIARPELITLEILENSRIASFSRVRQRLLECKQLGIRFSLDDFGTGYSSLTYMRQLPVDVLKIDQSFVRGMLQNREDFNIVQGIIALAHAFDHTVVAEGAETLDHLILLRQLGCDSAQGYGISMALPPEHMPQWVESWNQQADQDWAATCAAKGAALMAGVQALKNH